MRHTHTYCNQQLLKSTEYAIGLTRASLLTMQSQSQQQEQPPSSRSAAAAAQPAVGSSDAASTSCGGDAAAAINDMGPPTAQGARALVSSRPLEARPPQLQQHHHPTTIVGPSHPALGNIGNGSATAGAGIVPATASAAAPQTAGLPPQQATNHFLPAQAGLAALSSLSAGFGGQQQQQHQQQQNQNYPLASALVQQQGGTGMTAAGGVLGFVNPVQNAAAPGAAAFSGSQHHHQHSRLRSGKWLKEEEEYAEALIALFERGQLSDCENGATLRSYLSRKLSCPPMRISKKYAGKGIGKMVFLSRIGAGDSPVAELRALEANVKEKQQRFCKASYPCIQFFRVCLRSGLESSQQYRP